jgi:hypothetical protein
MAAEARTLFRAKTKGVTQIEPQQAQRRHQVAPEISTSG